MAEAANHRSFVGMGRPSLSREHGFSCDRGIVYLVISKERVPVPMDQALVDVTLKAIDDFKNLVAAGKIPPSLENSSK